MVALYHIITNLAIFSQVHTLGHSMVYYRDRTTERGADNDCNMYFLCAYVLYL